MDHTQKVFELVKAQTNLRIELQRATKESFELREANTQLARENRELRSSVNGELQVPEADSTRSTSTNSELTKFQTEFQVQIQDLRALVFQTSQSLNFADFQRTSETVIEELSTMLLAARAEAEEILASLQDAYARQNDELRQRTHTLTALSVKFTALTREVQERFSHQALLDQSMLQQLQLELREKASVLESVVQEADLLRTCSEENNAKMREMEQTIQQKTSKIKEQEQYIVQVEAEIAENRVSAAETKTQLRELFEAIREAPENATPTSTQEIAFCDLRAAVSQLVQREKQLCSESDVSRETLAAVRANLSRSQGEFVDQQQKILLIQEQATQLELQNSQFLLQQELGQRQTQLLGEQIGSQERTILLLQEKVQAQALTAETLVAESREKQLQIDALLTENRVCYISQEALKSDFSALQSAQAASILRYESQITQELEKCKNIIKLLGENLQKTAAQLQFAEMALAERVREYDVLREQVAVFAENVGNFSKFGAENANQLLFLRGQSAKTSDITELAQLANDEFARKMADFEKLQSENSGLTEQILTLQVKLATLQAELGAQNDAFSASQTQNNLNLKKLEILSLQNAALQRQVGGAERQGEALVSLEQSNKQNIELIQKLQNQNEKVNLKLVQLTEISQNQDGNALSEILTEQYQNIPFCLYEYCVENNVVNPKTSAKLKMKLLQDKMQLQAISKELKIDMKGLKYTILDRAGDDGKMSDIEYLLHCVKTMKVKISEKLDNFITYVNDRFDEDKNNVLASFEILKVKLEAV